MVKNDTIHGYTYLRVVACIGIVLLHTLNGAIGLYGGLITESASLVSKVMLNLLLWCVPCFVMITGALLLDPEKEISYEKLFKKYIFRILKALVFCCIVFCIFDAITHNESFTVSWSINLLLSIIEGTNWSHLWYLYLVVAIYLMMPLYKSITKAAKEKDIRYILKLFFIFLSLITIFSIFDINIAFYILSSTVYPFYVFAGYAIKKGIIKLSITQALIFVVGSSLLLIFFTYFQVSSQMDLSSLLNYSSPLVVIQSVGVFALFNNINFKENKFMDLLNDSSFGIYLLHMIFVRVILKYAAYNPYQGCSILSFIILVGCIFIFSFIIVKILKKVPFVKSFI